MELIDRVHREVVEKARTELNACADTGEGSYRWRGHRLVVVDGSSDSMPDTKALRKHYGVPSPAREGLGFPVSGQSKGTRIFLGQFKGETQKEPRV